MKKSNIDDLLNRVRGGYQKVAARVAPPRPPVAEEADDVPVGIHGVMAATEKLLAVNRGLIPPDERDSLQFKRVMAVDDHLKERVRMDADHLRINALRRAAKTRNLQGLHAGAFDDYILGHLISNPLSSPGEEINPLQNLEQSRRITQMGPGGLGSSQAVTEESQNIHPSQFGFISGLEGPESEAAGIDTRVAMGVKLGSDGQLYQKFEDVRSGRLRWMTSADAAHRVVKLPD